MVLYSVSDIQWSGNPLFLAHTRTCTLCCSPVFEKKVCSQLRMTADSNRMQSSLLALRLCVCVRGVGVVACMFFWSLFHLLFIFAVARSRSHVPLGACQVSGNQSEWLILPAQAQARHQEDAHTRSHTHSHTCTHSLLSAPFPFFYPFAVHWFISPELSVSRTLLLTELWNV